MISENDVVAIVKSHIAHLLDKSEQQEEGRFTSLPTDNFHLDQTIFSEIDNSIPAQVSDYWQQFEVFCALCDCVPNDDDKLSSSAFTSSLLKNYKHILENCVTEGENLTDAEKAKAQQASDFLYAEDGTPSEAYLKYLQIIDELYSLKGQLLADKDAADSISPDKRENWEQGIALLEGKIKSVERKLVVEGQKAVVESSIEILERVYKKHPETIVDSLKEKVAQLEPMGLETGLGPKSDYRPVQPSPPLQSIEIWQRVTIPEKEIGRIARLPQNAGISPGKIKDLAQIDYSWCSVYLCRHWFDATFFKSSYWTMPGDEVVSQGTRPNSGILPAYVKRVVITNDISYQVRTKIPKPTTSRTPASRPAVAFRVAGRPAMAVATPTVASSVARPALAASNIPIATLARKPTVATQLSPQNHLAIQKALTANAKLAIRHDRDNLRTYLAQRRFKPPAPKPDVKVESHSVKFDNPLILAFVCKRVPPCPSPAGS